MAHFFRCQDEAELGEDEEIATIDKDRRVKMALFEGIYRSMFLHCVL